MKTTGRSKNIARWVNKDVRGNSVRNKRERERQRGEEKRARERKEKRQRIYICISRDSRAIIQPCNVTTEDLGILSFWRDARKAGCPSLNFWGGTQRARYIIIRRSSGIRIPAAFQRYGRVALSPETPLSPPPLSYVYASPCVELAVDRSKSRVLKA